MTKMVTNSSQETFKLGLEFGQTLKGGEILALQGDLGAGKTCFLQGLAKGIGIKDKVNSPTFNILKVYKIPGKIKTKISPQVFCHIDAYRLRDERDLISLGAEEFFGDLKIVTAIEWAEKVKKILPKKTIVIDVKQISENQREIIIK
jgi:tRNA threonylcarbamoyladenosine biosynthesis protein TsaE